MAAVFGDEVIDMHGHIESGKDFIQEEHTDIELVEDTATKHTTTVKA
jgi:hypothetical protein